MTLLYLDSFAHQNTARYVGVGSPSWSSSGGRVQPYSASGGNGFKRLFTPSAEIVTGFGVNPSVANGQLALVILGDAGTTTHLMVLLDGNSKISVYRGGLGNLLATGSYTYSAGVWSYLEVRATIADSGGTVKVRVNGASTDDISFVGDTRNGGTSTNIDALTLAGGPVATTDWYVCNTLGSSNNTWLGDVAVRALVPTGDGDLSGLVGSDADSIANWQLVDELPASNSDYTGSATSAAEDTYAITDLPGTVAQVFGLQVAAVMAKSDAGAASASVIARVGSTDYTSGANALSTTYAEFVDFYETNPATSAQWTVSDVNALQVGMKVA